MAKTRKFSAMTLYTLLLPPLPIASSRRYCRPLMITCPRLRLLLPAAAVVAAVTAGTMLSLGGGGGGAGRCGVLRSRVARMSRRCGGGEGVGVRVREVRGAILGAWGLDCGVEEREERGWWWWSLSSFAWGEGTRGGGGGVGGGWVVEVDVDAFPEPVPVPAVTERR